MSAPLLFKVLSADHKSVYQGFDYKPYLPKKTVPGKWLPVEKKLGLCESGWHFTVRPELHWNQKSGAELYVAETKGKTLIGSGDKISAASGRLIERVDEKWEWLPLYPAIRALLYLSWRVKNPDAAIAEWADLSGAYLSGAYLPRADLSRANLSGADLSGAYLYGANLSGAYNVPPLPSGWKLSENGIVVRTGSW